MSCVDSYVEFTALRGEAAVRGEQAACGCTTSYERPGYRQTKLRPIDAEPKHVTIDDAFLSAAILIATRSMRSKWSIVALMLFMLPLRIRAGPARFEQTDVFIGGQDKIHTYRIPAIICSRKGTLLAFSEGRRTGAGDGVATDLVLKRSVQNGTSTNAGRRDRKATELAWNTIWRPMQTLIRSTQGEAYMNPVPLIDKSDGTILLFVNYYPQPYEDVPAQIWLLRSRDEGTTWTHPVDITPMVGKHELGPGTGIELRSGRLMVAVYDGAIFSDDHGKTWKSSDGAPGRPDEDQIAELNDGTLLLNRRHRGYREILRSKDQGQTWSEPSRTQIYRMRIARAA